jgi:hypothetical protein
LGYIIIVHKSQGLTINHAILNLVTREHYLGLSYIGYSRVKTLGSLLFEVPFHFNHFTPKNSANLIDKQIDYNLRGL